MPWKFFGQLDDRLSPTLEGRALDIADPDRPVVASAQELEVTIDRDDSSAHCASHRPARVNGSPGYLRCPAGIAHSAAQVERTVGTDRLPRVRSSVRRLSRLQQEGRFIVLAGLNLALIGTATVVLVLYLFRRRTRIATAALKTLRRVAALLELSRSTDADPVIPGGLPGARKRRSELAEDERTALLSLVDKLDTEVVSGVAIIDNKRDSSHTEW